MAKAKQTKYTNVFITYIRGTSLAYLGFYITLFGMMQLGLLSNPISTLIPSFVQVYLVQLFFYLWVSFAKDFNKDSLTLAIWLMVCNNCLIFFYWLYFMDETRAIILLLAPISTVSLFTSATFKQSAIFNFIQTACFVGVIYISEARLGYDDILLRCAVDWFYCLAFISVCVWMANASNKHAAVKKQRDIMVQKFTDAATSVINSTVIDKSAEQLLGFSENLHKIAAQQNQSVEQLATAAEELQATSENNAEKANSSLQLIRQTEEKVSISRSDMDKLDKSIAELKSSGKKIQEINNLINEIAYQTNILSLNAMIEASRGSEEGGGFKVVALEVKNLAARSVSAAEDINDLLAQNEKVIQNSVELSSTVQERFASISEEVKPLAQVTRQVSESSYEQVRAIRQVSEGFLSIEQQAEKSEELAVSSREVSKVLKSNAKDLVELLETLKQ